LQAFLAVAECSSFSDAAKLLGKSQPSISNRMKRLEEKLQKQLIIRDAKSIQLSEDGQNFQHHAMKLVDDMAVLHDRFHEKGKRRKSTIHVCSPIMLASAIIGPTIKRFHKANPEIAVLVKEDIPKNCIQRVIDGTSEIAILSDVDFPPEVRFKPVYRDVCHAVSAAGHPLTRNKSATIAEILKYPMLSPDINMALREEIEIEAAKHKIKINYVPEAFGVTNYVSLLSMASSDMGVAIASTGLIPGALKGIMSITEIEDAEFVRTFGIVTARNKRLSASARIFCEHVEKLGAQLELVQSRA
jgi:LysR family transcriptional activator of glutamate synthase operon